MSRFAEPHFAGIARANTNNSTTAIGNMGSALDGSRTLAGMLLAAAMAALLVVADQLIDTWADGHLLVAWVALWTLAFAALALLAPPLRQMAAVIAGSMVARLNRLKADSEEARMWELASHDPRVLAEIHAAIERHAE